MHCHRNAFVSKDIPLPGHTVTNLDASLGVDLGPLSLDGKYNYQRQLDGTPQQVENKLEPSAALFGYDFLQGNGNIKAEQTAKINTQTGSVEPTKVEVNIDPHSLGKDAIDRIGGHIYLLNVDVQRTFGN